MYSRTYSAGEVIKALDVYNTVKSLRKTALITKISKSSIQRWWCCLRRVIKRKDKRKKRVKRRHKYPDLELNVQNLFHDEHVVFWDLKHLQTTLKRLHNIFPSLTTLYRVLKRCNISRRRFNSYCVNPRTLSERKQRFLEFKEDLDKFSDDQIVCLDEVSFCNVGNTCYGYFPCGKQPKMISVPKRERYSVVMVVHPTIGVVSYNRVNKAFNKTTFIEFLNNLVPQLPRQTKAVLMDNVAFHRSRDVVQFLELHGIKPLYIPPYSPRCNPIEEVFSLLKRAFRTKTTKSGFIDRVEESIGILKGYKDLTPFYKHTRGYVQKECHT